MIFIVTLSILIVVTGIITIRGHKDSKNLKIVGRVYYVFYFLCFLLLMKSYSLLDRPFTETPFKEMQYILIFPCVVDCFCGILYKVYVIKKHYKVYLPVLIICWIVYVGINIKYNKWGILLLVCGLFSVNLITRMATVYRIFSGKDERLFSPTYGTSLFISIHFLPLASVLAIFACIFLLLNCNVNRSVKALHLVSDVVSESNLHNERERRIKAIQKTNANGVKLQTIA